MAGALGRAGRVQVAPGNNAVVIEGISAFLNKMNKEREGFNKEMRKASIAVANMLVVEAKAEAAGSPRSSQATEVMKGMVAKSDRIPTVSLRSSSGFVSRSRPNGKRKTKVTRGDVFFGAEFGGGKSGAGSRTVAHAEVRRTGKQKQNILVRTARKGGGTTTQFLPHLGRHGYFFWPAVRKNKEKIAIEYMTAIGEVLSRLRKKEGF